MKIQEGSQNVVRNSGFDVAEIKQPVFKLTFTTSDVPIVNNTVAGMGITN